MRKTEPAERRQWSEGARPLSIQESERATGKVTVRYSQCSKTKPCPSKAQRLASLTPHHPSPKTDFEVSKALTGRASRDAWTLVSHPVRGDPFVCSGKVPSLTLRPTEARVSCSTGVGVVSLGSAWGSGCVCVRGLWPACLNKFLDFVLGARFVARHCYLVPAVGVGARRSGGRIRRVAGSQKFFSTVSR